jgi:hypothetical protein
MAGRTPERNGFFSRSGSPRVQSSAFMASRHPMLDFFQ